MKPKVLIVSTTFPRWENDKIPSFVYDFAVSIKPSCQVHVLAPHVAGAKRFEYMSGIAVYRFVYAPEKFEKFGEAVSIISILKRSKIYALMIPIFIIFGVSKLIELQFKNRYNVIHVNWLIPFGPVVGLFRYFTKFRYIVTSHGSDVFPFSGKAGLLSFMVNWSHRVFTFPKTDQIVAVSTSLKDAIVKMSSIVYEKKISVISMGIKYEKFANGARFDRVLQKPLRLVFVGRLEEVKGVSYLIAAIKILHAKNIDCKLQIFGDGSLRSCLEDQADKLGLSEHVVFNGFIGHNVLASKLTEFDIFIGPSVVTPFGEAEGFGLVFLEAMAAGLIVIGTNVGGTSDIILNGKTGVLVQEKDPEAIANAVFELYSSKEMQQRLIEGGKHLAINYDWSFIANKYLMIYGSET